jgi:hypothetical protein
MGFRFDYAIQKPALVANIHRLRFIKRRLPFDKHPARAKGVDRVPNILGTISEIGPERQIGGLHTVQDRKIMRPYLILGQNTLAYQ